MAHFTANDWMQYVRSNFPTVGDAERWRNANNVFVDGMPPPAYTGPLSNGDATGAPPPPQMQGSTPVATLDPSAVAPGAASGPLPGPAAAPSRAPEAQDFLGQSRGLSAEEQAAAQKTQQSLRDQYEASRAAIMARRYGPSRTEQLFNLAAAIGTPVIRPSFGSVMANVAPALSSMTAASRQAEQDRAAALMALQQSYLTSSTAAQNEAFKARRAAMGPEARVIAAIDKSQGPIARATVDTLGASHNKAYGNAIYQPPVGNDPASAAARARFLSEQRALKDFTTNPATDPAAREAAKRKFDDVYGFGAADVYGE